MRQSPYFKPNKQVITFLGLLLPIILLIWFRQYPNAVEHYYTRGIYRLICYATRPLLNLLPFSLGDVLYAIVILLLFSGLFRLLRFVFTKRFKLAGKLFLRFIICLQIAWLWFYSFWGLNYYRPPAAQLLGLNDTAFTLKDVAKVTTIIIDSANALRACLNPADIAQSNNYIYATAATAVKLLGNTAPVLQPVGDKVKPSIYSHLLNYIGTSGYYNPFTAEAQLNYLMPIANRPFVACHEMGHQTGFAREDEANFVGFVAGINAPDKLLRYSAYYAGLAEFMPYLRRRDTAAYRVLRLQVSPLVRLDFKADSAYWTKYMGPAEIISGLFFDKFLKANNQPQGIRTYNRMIRLTMGYYRKRGIVNSPVKQL